MVQQRRELLLLPFLALWRTPLNPWDTLAPLCVGRMLGCAMFSLTSQSSLPNLRRRFPALVWLVHRYYTEVRPSAACMSGLRPWALPDRPVTASGITEVSRFSCMKFLSVRGVYDYAGPGSGSRYRHRRCCLPPCDRVGIPIGIFEAQYPAHRCRCLRFDEPPCDGPRKTRGQDGFAISFPVGLFHSLLHAGFIPAHHKRAQSRTTPPASPQQTKQNPPLIENWVRIAKPPHDLIRVYSCAFVAQTR